MIAPLTKTRPAPVTLPPDPALRFPRRFARGTFFWLFGLSASILIGSLWGSGRRRWSTGASTFGKSSAETIQRPVGGGRER